MKVNLIRFGAMALALGTPGAVAQTVRDVRGPAGVVTIASEPASKIIVDPPLAAVARAGRHPIPYRELAVCTGDRPAALAVSPRIISGLPAGPHTILVELANANHKTLDQATVSFLVP